MSDVVKNSQGEPTALVAAQPEEKILSRADLAAQAKADLEILQNLDDSAFDNAPVITSKYWERPSKGDIKIGSFLGYFQMANQDTGEMVVGIRFRSKDGVWVSAATALVQACGDGGVDVGDFIRVEALGEKKVNKGKMLEFEVKKLDRSSVVK